MSRNYKFHNPVGVYFVSFAVVEWIDVFTRNIQGLSKHRKGFMRQSREIIKA